jgi:hypothetical protein
MNNVFEYIFWEKDTARRTFDKQTLVYSSDKVHLVYHYCKALEYTRLLQLHSSEIADSDARINQVEREQNRLRIEMSLSDELCTEFRPMHYLDSTAVTIESLTKQRVNENNKLFPRMFRRRLRFLFKEFHTYKFYEENYRSMLDGYELLLKSAYRLEKLIPSHFNIDIDIWSGDNEFNFDFQLVHDYYGFIEGLNKPRKNNRKKLSQDEVASILTGYVSTNEVRAMGVEIKSLHLDIGWYGPTVESLIGEAVVIGKNPEELITVFENSDGPFVTVVTGPHFGHARNREIFMVDIEDEDSLRTVVNEWLKSGTD